jgi:hypothetical protein
MKKVGFVSLGCPKNLVDSEVMCRMFGLTTSKFMENLSMYTTRHFLAISIITLLAALTAATQISPAQDLSGIPKKVNAALYNLPSHKVDSFSSKISPDWRVIAPAVTADPEAMKLLNGIHFKVLHDIQGQTKLEHFEDVPMSTQQQKDALDGIVSGMKQVVDGFYTTWDAMMVFRPVVTDGSAAVTADGSGYLIKWKQGTSDIAVKVGNDMAITELMVTAPEYVSIIQPKFIGSSRGMILSAYKGTYTSKNAAENTNLDVVIDYHEVDGIKLVKRLQMNGTYGGSPIKTALEFSDEQVMLKQP